MIVKTQSDVVIQMGGKHFVEFMGEVGLAITYALVSIGWFALTLHLQMLRSSMRFHLTLCLRRITMVLRAKTLGHAMGMIRYRIAVFILLCVLIPIYAVLTFTELFVSVEKLTKDGKDIIDLIMMSIQLFYLLVILGGTTWQIIIILHWAKGNEALRDKVMRRTAILLASNICLLGLLLAVLGDVVCGEQTWIDRFCASCQVH